MPNENGANPDTQAPEGADGGVATPIGTDGARDTGTPDSTQTTNPKWMSQLPDELKGNELLAKYDSLGNAFKGLLDGSGAKPEDGGNTVTEGNTSDDAGEITYAFTKSFSEELDSTGDLDKSLTEALKSLKLDAESADAIHSAIIDSHEHGMNQLRTNGEKLCKAELQKMWGDAYDAKQAAMKRAYDHLVPADSPLAKGLRMTQSENNPFVADLLARVGESISEHTPPLSSTSGGAKSKGNGYFLNRENDKFPWAM